MRVVKKKCRLLAYHRDYKNMPTPGPPIKHYEIGAVNYHSDQTVVMIPKRKKREQISLLLEELLAKHPDQRVYVDWDNAHTHSGGKVKEVVRAAAERLALLLFAYLQPLTQPN